MTPVSPWFAPALLMNASAIALVYLLSFTVARRQDSTYFRWWVAAAGLNTLGASFQVIDFLLWPQSMAFIVAMGIAPVSAMALVACARRYRHPAPLAKWKWGLVVVCWLLTGALFASGQSHGMVAIPAALFQSASHLWFGWVYWPRRHEPRSLGAIMVSLCSLIWGLHILCYPLLAAHALSFALGYWLSALIHTGLGVGMIVHLYEQSHEREQALTRQLNQTNQDLMRTVNALSESRSEAQLSAAIALEQEALVRQIVHDLRNSTQAISLITEDIEAVAGETPQVAQSLAALDRQVRFISNFLKEKLAWIVDRRPTPGDGTEVTLAFEALAATFGPIFASKGQALALEPAPSAALRLSPVQFEQIIGNMLRNAHQHCPPGTSARLWTAISDGWATFYVADDGPGIPLERQGDLGRGVARKDGTGIGLSNVHDLVTTAGGLFGVVSEFGRGSTFYVTLPLAWWGLRVPGEQATAEV